MVQRHSLRHCMVVGGGVQCMSMYLCAYEYMYLHVCVCACVVGWVMYWGQSWVYFSDQARVEGWGSM